MLSPSRELYIEETRPNLRSLLGHSRQYLENLQHWLARHPAGLEPSAQIVGDALRATIEKVTTEHARLDLELLLEAGVTWEHPVQIICRPRAPFEAVARACTQRLDGAEGSEAESLQAVHRRVERAHLIDTEARARRQAARQEQTNIRND